MTEHDTAAEIVDWYDERVAIMAEADDVPDPERAAAVRALLRFGHRSVLATPIRQHITADVIREAREDLQ